MKSTAEDSRNFWAQYSNHIEPFLQDIDIFIRSGEPITPENAAELLFLTPSEVREIMHSLNIHHLDRKSFFLVMKHGSSELCHLFKRELDRGTPEYYSPEDISYIYNIDLDNVLYACAKIGQKQFTANSLKKLFVHIIQETS